MTTKKTTKTTTQADKPRKTTKKKVVKGSNSGAKKSSTTPNIKVRKYINGLAEGKSKTKSAKEAGYSDSTARNAGQKIETTQAFLNEVEKFKQYLGGEDSYLELMAKRLIQLLNKNESSFYKNQDEEMCEFIGSLPDGTVVLGAIDKIAKITSLYSPQTFEILDKDKPSNLSNEELKRRIKENQKRLTSIKNE